MMMFTWDFPCRSFVWRTWGPPLLDPSHSFTTPSHKYELAWIPLVGDMCYWHIRLIFVHAHKIDWSKCKKETYLDNESRFPHIDQSSTANITQIRVTFGLLLIIGEGDRNVLDQAKVPPTWNNEKLSKWKLQHKIISPRITESRDDFKLP